MHPENNTWIIVCDFDGTISIEDATDILLDRFSGPDWIEIEKDWLDNCITTQECLTRQTALLRAEQVQLDAVADELQMDPHFPAFVDWCAAHAIPVAIVSEGFENLILRMLGNHGLGHLPVYSNRLVRTGALNYRLDMPMRADTCKSNAAVCKCSVIQRLKEQTGSSHCFYIGDGRSDFCAADHEADFVCAKSTLRDHLSAGHKHFVPFDSFRDVITALESGITPSTPSLHHSRSNSL